MRSEGTWDAPAGTEGLRPDGGESGEAVGLGDSDVRRRSVLALAQAGEWDVVHSRDVTELALSLFDQLRGLHGLGPEARELLRYAGWLHDLGYRISAKGHHKHTHRLVSNADLSGFAPWEIQVMAAVGRYHRKRRPRIEHKELEGLSTEQRGLVKILAGILRVADGADRTHFGLIRQVRVTLGADLVVLSLVAIGRADLEAKYAQRKADLLERVLGRTVQARLLVISPSEVLADQRVFWC